MLEEKCKIYYMCFLWLDNPEQGVIRISFLDEIDKPYEIQDERVVKVASKQAFLEKVHQELKQMGFTEFRENQPLNRKWFLAPVELKDALQNNFLDSLQTIREAECSEPMENRYTLDSRFRDWFDERYSLKEMRVHIWRWVTFRKLLKVLENGGDIYRAMGSGWSETRIALFTGLAEVTGKPQSYFSDLYFKQDEKE